MLTVGSGAMDYRLGAHTKPGADLFEKLLWLLLLVENICFLALSSYGWGIYAMVAVAFLFAVVAIVQSRMRIGLSVGIFHKLLLAFCAFGLLSAGWAIDPSRAVTRSITLFELLILISIFYAHYALRPDKKMFDDLIKMLMWSGYILSLYTIYAVGLPAMLEGISNGGRLDADYANINSIGMSCALAVVIALFYAFYRKPTFSLFFILPCLLVVAATASRKALLMIVLGGFLIVMSALLKKKFTSKLWFIAGMIVSASVLVAVLERTGIFSNTIDRLGGVLALFSGTGEVEASANVRAEMIEIGLVQFLRAPILGIGLDNSYYLAGTYLHNNYIELLVDLGIVGFGIFYSIYIYIIYKLWKTRSNKNPYGLLVAILVFILLVMDFASVSYFSKSTFVYLMVMFLYINMLDKTKRTEQARLP